jgi:carbonic anhydrase/acetyltransferase-like protein (isoleucine patch superfamily)
MSKTEHMDDFSEMKPEIHPETFIAEGARIIGRVILGRGASVWYNCVLRADIAAIRIGENTNIQDQSVLHVDFDAETVLGANVTVGHAAILHACRVGDNCLIGMGATVLNGAVIPPNSILAAGSLVPPKKTYPPGTLILGSPAKVVRTLGEDEIRRLAEHAAMYVALWKAYAAKGIGGSGPHPPVRRP